MRPLPFLGGADDVILDVCMSSPMYLWMGLVNHTSRFSQQRQENDEVVTYDCRNLLPPSSFSCSLLTVSTRSTMACRLVCSIWACSMRSRLASSLSLSTSSLFRRGDMARTSSSSKSESTTVVGASRETIMVPLLFLLPSLGLPRRELDLPLPSSSLTTALESGEGSEEWPSTMADWEIGSSIECTASSSRGIFGSRD